MACDSYCFQQAVNRKRRAIGIVSERLQTGIGTCNLSGSRNGDVSFVGSFRCTDGVMALINIPVILILSELAFKAVQDYEAQLKKGINPVLKAQTSGLVKKQISGDRFNKS